MGLYFRKSIRLGPIRLNLSKSGIGASVGITGLRYGIRPNGTEYVHAGRYGVYYRQELTRNRSARTPTASNAASTTTQPTNVFSASSAASLAKASTSQMLQLLAQPRQWHRIDMLVGLASTAVCIGAFFINPTLAAVALCLSIWLVALCARWEIRRRSICLHYTSIELRHP